MRLTGIAAAVTSACLLVGAVSPAQAMTAKVIGTYDVGGSPIRVWANNAAGQVFIADSDGTVTLYDPQKRSVVMQHSGLGEIRDMIDAADGERLVVLVLSASPARLTAFDPETGRKVWTRDLPGADPTTVLYDYQADRWLVADRANGEIITPTGRIAVGGAPIALAGPSTYGDIHVVSPTQVVVMAGLTGEVGPPLALPGRATDAAMAYGATWITTEEGLIIGLSPSGDAIERTFDAGGRLTGLWVRYLGQVAYVADEQGSQLLVVDLEKQKTLGSLALPSPPTDVATIWDDYSMHIVSKDAGQLYVADIRLTKRPGRPQGATATCTLDGEGTHLRLTWKEPAILPEGPIKGYKVRLIIDGKRAGRWSNTSVTYMDFDWPYRMEKGTKIAFQISATSFAGSSPYARATCTLR